MRQGLQLKSIIFFAILLGLNLSAIAQSTVFNYSGTIVSYTVPAGVMSISIDSRGGQGGNTSVFTGATGGSGAIMSGNFSVTPGQVLNILVGGMGQNAANVAGGGGGSFVWDNGTSSLLIAAGGGGGAGTSWNSSMGINGLNATTAINGINGVTMPNGGGIAGNGGTVPTGGVDYYAAGGAGWLSNGANGITIGGCINPAAIGGTTPLGGGAGGTFGGDDNANIGSGGFGGGGGAQGRCGAVGGGGGGGYSGGGAGGELSSLPNDYTAGGGGGSFSLGTNQINSVGNTGNGVVTICAYPVPGAVTGTTDVCAGSTTVLANGTGVSGGTWSSSNNAVATVGSNTGVVSGVAAGTVTITYTTPANACGTSIATTIVTVNALPSPITGTFSVCEGSVTNLNDATLGGTWSSSNTSLATVGTSSGIVTGVSAGTPDITYMLPTGCIATQNITVNPLPAGITGLSHVCVASMITLSDVTSGGTWSSSNTGIAAVGSTSGDVTGVAGGNVSIAYTLTATGCMVSFPITVNPLPIVSAGSDVTICYGNSTPLTGTGADVYSWSPASGLSCTNCPNPSASPATTTTYTVTGTTFTSSTPIVYNQSFTNGVTATTQCTAWDVFRSSLLGSYSYSGFTMRGSMNTTGITCTDPVVASAVADALRNGTSYSGSSDGQTWTVGIGCGTGCGGGIVELTNTIGTCVCTTGYTLRPNIGNDNWGGIDGPTCSAASQTMEVVFYIGDGCSNTSVVTVSVNPLPVVYNVIGGGNYCFGGTGVNIGLDSSNAGIRYQLYYGLTSTGAPVDGIEDTIYHGLQTGAGTYTIVATDTISGCVNDMSGVATVVVDPLVYPAINIFRSTSDTICDGTHTTFTTSIVEGGPNPVYIWKVNGATVGTDSIAYDYAPADGNRVSVTLVSDAVCATPDTVHSDTLYMTVFPNGIPTVTLSAGPNDTVCEGTGVTVTATPTFGGYGPTYTWVKNTAVVGTASTYSYIPIDGDNIYAVMVSNYMCRLATTAYSNVVDMTVVDPIVPSVTITGKPGMTILPGMADTLTATVLNGGSAPTYQWLVNNVPVAGATTSVFIKSSFNDRDSISCRVTRNDACGLSTINSVVLRVYKVAVPVLTAGNNVSLIPNPNKGTFSVKGSLGLTSDETVTVVITNMLGQSVYNGNFVAQGGNIDQQIQMGNVASGIYMLTLHSAAGNNVFRFVVD